MVGLVGTTVYWFYVCDDALVVTVCTTVCIACLVIGPDCTGIIDIRYVLQCDVGLVTGYGKAGWCTVDVTFGFGTVQRICHISGIGSGNGLVRVTAGFGTVAVTGPACFAGEVGKNGDVGGTVVQAAVNS